MYSACDVDASSEDSARPLFCMVTADVRTAGRVCRAAWRTKEVAALAGRAIVKVWRWVCDLEVEVKEARWVVMLLLRESPKKFRLPGGC